METLDLLDASDLDVLIEEEKKIEQDLDLSDLEEIDDLNSLKNDIGGNFLDEIEAKGLSTKVLDDDIEIIIDEKKRGDVVNDENYVPRLKTKKVKGKEAIAIFDIGDEEQNLLEVSKYVERKIQDDEWNEIYAGSKVDKYIVQEGDWLWKISQSLFGTGFYYSKIWSLNPQITNPHEIEPGQVLLFDTGNSDSLPEVKLGDFKKTTSEERKKLGKVDFEFDDFGAGVKPDWIDERRRLIKEGTYFQFASEETYKDLGVIAKSMLRTEHEKYEPPIPDIVITEPGDAYDDTGFDKNSRIEFDVKEGFFLNSFITSNLVQDLGKISAIRHEGLFIRQFDHVYVEFDDSVKVKPGDMFSVYSAEGKSQHIISDRSGYRYTITGQIKAIKLNNDIWECIVTELIGIVQRKDRITVFTPKINKIQKTFNKRSIEAAILDSYKRSSTGISFGDVAYLDRGRADGVELGNVFEIFSFKDRGTGKKITPDPTYKIGEVTVITLTDNFSTILITQSSTEMNVGHLALAKTQEAASRDSRVKNQLALTGIQDLEKKALDELDVELNLDDINEDLLDQADKIQLTEDELAELERQEREKSIIKNHERDIRELNRLEKEIEEAESSLSEAKLDEDKFLEQENLDDIERKTKNQDPNGFEALNEIEQEFGRKYMDEEINSKDNPYGLTEFDLEEIDELLNTESL